MKRRFLFSLAALLLMSEALFAATTATSTVSRLRVRSRPNVDAGIVAFLAKGESVSLIERSTFTAQADGKMSWWYYVATKEGKEGWVFGLYLDTGEAPPAPAPAATPARSGPSVPVNRLDFRVGVVKPETKDVYLYSEPRKGLNYHVLTLQGATLYIGKPAKKTEVDPCGEAPLVRWRLKPRQDFKKENLPFQPIVVGAPTETFFAPVVKKNIDLDNQTKQAYLLNLELPADFPRKYVRAHAHYAGTANGRERFILLYESQQMPVVGLTKAVVSVAERAGGGELAERHTFYKRRQYGDMGLGFGGMLDPNGDGVAEVFLVDFGESEGTYLLTEEPGGGWRRQEDDIPGPCQ